ncbi:MAG: hypothetical protein WCP97_01390 [bacterium]
MYHTYGFTAALCTRGDEYDVTAAVVHDLGAAEEKYGAPTSVSPKASVVQDFLARANYHESEIATILRIVNYADYDRNKPQQVAQLHWQENRTFKLDLGMISTAFSGENRVKEEKRALRIIVADLLGQMTAADYRTRVKKDLGTEPDGTKNTLLLLAVAATAALRDRTNNGQLLQQYISSEFGHDVEERFLAEVIIPLWSYCVKENKMPSDSAFNEHTLLAFINERNTAINPVQQP